MVLDPLSIDRRRKEEGTLRGHVCAALSGRDMMGAKKKAQVSICNTSRGSFSLR